MNYFRPELTNKTRLQGGTSFTLTSRPVSKAGKGIYISLLGGK